MTRPMSELFDKLDYTFQCLDLFNTAITHRSFSQQHYERLEFLGDSVIDFVIAEALYNKLPKSREGDLSRFRASLVRKESLAALARTIQLGDFIQLGLGEINTGGRERESILADAFEAVIGAVYLDSDLQECKRVILQLYKDRLDNLSEDDLKDPKTQLQEYMQARQLALPVYTVVHAETKGSYATFRIECHVDSIEMVSEGEGSSRRRAEQQAAEAFLNKLNENE